MPISSSIEYFLPTRIIFGNDVSNRIGETSVEYTNRVFLITSGEYTRKIGLLPKIETLLEKSGVDYIMYDDITRDPSPAIIDEIGDLIAQSKVKLVVALGGRSVINAVKAACYMARNDGSITDYINGKIGKDESVPCIIIPTIPGVNQVISDDIFIKDSNDNIKKVFKNKALFPLITLVDPKLSMTLPVNYTVGSGFAVLSNAIESYISSAANPISDALALKAIDFSGKNLRNIFMNREDLQARSRIMMASILVALSLLTSKPGTCEAISLSLSAQGGLYQNISHAIMIPHLMEFNLTTAPNKYVQIARALGEDISNVTVVEAAIRAIEGVRKLLFDLKVPQKLSEYNVKKEDIPHISGISRRYNFLNYAPTPISKEDILNILLTAF
ncbi:MAG: iron-containing alcohol dehydrogenase [Spirochaetes bacterium]|nr:iron-containing alcohol dehydrogenase [Spirochaetota bacterium]